MYPYKYVYLKDENMTVREIQKKHSSEGACLMGRA